jgi:hypothetical protein
MYDWHPWSGCRIAGSVEPLTLDRLFAFCFEGPTKRGAAVAIVVISAWRPPMSFTGTPSHIGNECADWTWSEPKIIAAASSKVARFSRLLAVGRRVYIVRNNIRSLDPVRSDAWAMYTADGQSVPAPPGDFSFLFPVGAASGETLWVVWAEPSKEQAAQPIPWFVLRPEALWAASWTPRAGWSTPRVVRQGPFMWIKGATDGLAESPGEFALAIARPAEAGGGLLFLTLNNGDFATSAIPGTDGALMAPTGAFGPFRYVAFLNAREGVERDQNSVFIVTSHDGGASWSDPHLLSASGMNRADHVRLRVSGTGAVELTWLQTLPNSSIALSMIGRQRGDVAPPFSTYFSTLRSPRGE